MAAPAKKSWMLDIREKLSQWFSAEDRSENLSDISKNLAGKIFSNPRKTVGDVSWQNLYFTDALRDTPCRVIWAIMGDDWWILFVSATEGLVLVTTTSIVATGLAVGTGLPTLDHSVAHRLINLKRNTYTDNRQPIPFPNDLPLFNLLNEILGPNEPKSVSDKYGNHRNELTKMVKNLKNIAPKVKSVATDKETELLTSSGSLDYPKKIANLLSQLNEEKEETAQKALLKEANDAFAYLRKQIENQWLLRLVDNDIEKRLIENGWKDVELSVDQYGELSPSASRQKGKSIEIKIPTVWQRVTAIAEVLWLGGLRHLFYFWLLWMFIGATIGVKILGSLAMISSPFWVGAFLVVAAVPALIYLYNKWDTIEDNLELKESKLQEKQEEDQLKADFEQALKSVRLTYLRQSILGKTDDPDQKNTPTLMPKVWEPQSDYVKQIINVKNKYQTLWYRAGHILKNMLTETVKGFILFAISGWVITSIIGVALYLGSTTLFGLTSAAFITTAAPVLIMMLSLAAVGAIYFCAKSIYNSYHEHADVLEKMDKNLKVERLAQLDALEIDIRKSLEEKIKDEKDEDQLARYEQQLESISSNAKDFEYISNKGVKVTWYGRLWVFTTKLQEGTVKFIATYGSGGFLARMAIGLMLSIPTIAAIVTAPLGAGYATGLILGLGALWAVINFAIFLHQNIYSEPEAKLIDDATLKLRLEYLQGIGKSLGVKTQEFTVPADDKQTNKDPESNFEETSTGCFGLFEYLSKSVVNRMTVLEPNQSKNPDSVDSHITQNSSK